MLVIHPSSSGGSQTPIREPDAKTPIRKPDADPSSWRLQRIHTPDGLADSPGNGVPPSRKLIFRYRLRCWPLTQRPLAGARSRSVSQTPRHRCVSQTPIRRRGAFSGPTPLMAWRTPPGTGCPQAESLCSDIDSDAGHSPVVLWTCARCRSVGQTPINRSAKRRSTGRRRSIGQTPIGRGRGLNLSLGQTPILRRRGAYNGCTPTLLMAWRTHPRTGYPQAESLCSDIDSDAGSL